jgi:hypothetical protein
MKSVVSRGKEGQFVRTYRTTYPKRKKNELSSEKDEAVNNNHVF